MSDNTVHLTFLPTGKTVEGVVGDSIMDLALAAGIHINASCGGSGTCGQCKVKVESGAVQGGYHAKLTPEEIRQGQRLACMAEVHEDCVVEILASSEVDHTAIERGRTGQGGRALQETELRNLIQGLTIDPTVFKAHLQLAPPDKDDVLPDLDRLLLALNREHGFHPVSADFRAVRQLGPILRSSGWEVTATLAFLGDRYKLIQVESGDTVKENYAIVVDIGTTTLAAQLLDLKECQVVDCADDCPDDCNTLAGTSRYNPQISYGEDVINRILQAIKPHGLETMQKVVVDGINEMVEQLLTRSGVLRERISHMVVAGNSTMSQIFLGLDPRSIREAPYVTTVSTVPVVSARELGIHLGDHVHVWSFPLVASWVGGDIVAGVLGSGIWQRDATTLFIDVGTNGEIVLGNREWLVTTSCSAGPAFEGGGIVCGMRAAKGAIEDVWINPETFEVNLGVIGRRKPRGICGSGLIAAVAELFEKGVVEPNGKYHEELDTPRLRGSQHGGREFVLAWANETETGEDIVLTETDLDNLIRTKAAIYAGCKVLLDSVGLGLSDVEQVIIAGGFGQALDLEKSVAIGLLPPLPTDRFLFVGNGALLGARFVSFSREMHVEAGNVARMMTHVDLADNTAFMDQYVAAMFLPHTDATEFEARLHEAAA